MRFQELGRIPCARKTALRKRGKAAGSRAAAAAAHISTATDLSATTAVGTSAAAASASSRSGGPRPSGASNTVLKLVTRSGTTGSTNDGRRARCCCGSVATPETLTTHATGGTGRVRARTSQRIGMRAAPCCHCQGLWAEGATCATTGGIGGDTASIVGRAVKRRRHRGKMIGQGICSGSVTANASVDASAKATDGDPERCMGKLPASNCTEIYNVSTARILIAW